MNAHRSTLNIGLFLGLSGATLAQAPLYDIATATPGEALGSSVAGLGDVDGDGFGDLAVGARDADGLQADSGVVRIFSGKTGAMIRELDGERTGDRFGYSVAALGDVDGDLRGDLIVGAPRNEPTGGTDRGAIYVYSGASGAQLKKLIGGSDGDQLGWAVTGVPDVNLDGVPDYAFSEPWGDSGGLTDNGTVWVYSGATGTFLRSYNGAATADHFGYSIDGSRDVNNDSRGDILIGAPQADAAGIFDSGRGYVASGAASATFITTLSGSTVAGWFSHTVASLPDVSGDGRPEVMFGEPFVSVGGVAGSGRIRVYTMVTGALLREIAGDAHDNLGWVLDGLEDFDGDGMGDILAGIPAAEWPPYSDAGTAMVYSGATGAQVGWMTGYHANEGFGAAVADAGDINLDGFHDAIAGSPSYDLNGADAGRGRVILGNAPWPSGYCTAKVNSLGCTPVISFGGCASVTVGDNLNIVGVNVLPNVNGIMIWSLTPTAGPFYGGTLCVGAPVHRTPVQTATSNPGAGYPCEGVYTYLFSHAEMASAGLAPGMDLYAQYWSRDNGFLPPGNVGLTGGIKIPILP